jgi:hypothetical protein
VGPLRTGSDRGHHSSEVSRKLAPAGATPPVTPGFQVIDDRPLQRRPPGQLVQFRVVPTEHELQDSPVVIAGPIGVAEAPLELDDVARLREVRRKLVVEQPRVADREVIALLRERPGEELPRPPERRISSLPGQWPIKFGNMHCQGRVARPVGQSGRRDRPPGAVAEARAFELQPSQGVDRAAEMQHEPVRDIKAARAMPQRNPDRR